MRYFLSLIIFLLPACSLANDWDALRLPGAHAIMRHALAPGTSDPPGFAIDDCATQRNLDARGREQARVIGAELRARGYSFDRVMTSQWCRCRETADLLDVGPVSEATALNSFFQDRSSRDARTAGAQDIIATAQSPLLLVTHQVNITALTGRPVSSGEIIVVRNGDRGVEVLGSIRIEP